MDKQALDKIVDDIIEALKNYESYRKGSINAMLDSYLVAEGKPIEPNESK